jgi:tetratricopeptide (TPR) repeat protein
LYYFNRGMIHARLMNFELAIDDFTSGIKHIKSDQTETNFKALFHRGNCYRQIKNYERSIEDLEAACKLVSDDAPAQNNLGLSYF